MNIPHPTATGAAHDPGRVSGLLEDLTVLDLTQHLSGPYASQMLGDLGARVIKVEPPAGDPTRVIGPHFHEGLSAYFISVNRNKQSVCIDLKTDDGRATLLALVAHADVLIENFRPGTLDRLGIGYDTLVAHNSSLVVCSISGFGQDAMPRSLSGSRFWPGSS